MRASPLVVVTDVGVSFAAALTNFERRDIADTTECDFIDCFLTTLTGNSAGMGSTTTASLATDLISYQDGCRNLMSRELTASERPPVLIALTV
jgi:hypothetical protein